MDAWHRAVKKMRAIQRSDLSRYLAKTQKNEYHGLRVYFLTWL